MPVRVKQRAIESIDPSSSLKEWDALRKDITSLILAWPRPVTVNVKEVASNTRSRTMRISSRAKDVSTDSALVAQICSILAQASFISSADASFWVSATGSTATVSIKSGISLDPAPTKNVQFISFGIHPLRNEDGRNVLYEEINRLFANSSFGIVEDLPQLDDMEKRRRAEDRRYKRDGFTNKELKGSGKGIDRWPMFYIRIDMHDKPTDQESIEDLFDDEKALSSIMKLLQAVIIEFLKSNNFTPKFVGAIRSPSRSYTIESRDVRHVDLLARTTSGDGKVHPSASPSQTKISESAANLKSPRSIMQSATKSPTNRPASLFDIWPRVKSGRAPGMPAVSKFALPESAVPAPVSPYTKDSAPLISKSGAVARLPFLDVADDKKPQTIASRAKSLIEEPSGLEIEKDELVLWTDPVTKKDCYINKRTGLIEQKANPCHQPGDSTLLPSTSTRMSHKYPRSKPEVSQVSPRPASPWLDDILKTWNNPVFPPVEPSIPQVSLTYADSETHSILRGHRHTCSHADIDRAFQSCAAGALGQLTKAGLRRAEVIAQIDRKFILKKMGNGSGNGSGGGGGEMLVLVDQHAADERCRIEGLLEEFCEAPARTGRDGVKAGVRTAVLEKGMKFEVSKQEAERLEVQRQHFADWGVLYYIRPANPMRGQQDQVIVTELPEGVAERCRLDPKLVVDLIRRELWEFEGKTGASSGGGLAEHDDDAYGGDKEGKEEKAGKHEEAWVRRIHGCPRGILEMLNSRACRSAIMFNDELSVEERERLVERLGGCKFPFLCAHGRPSMVPLVDLGTLGMYGERSGGKAEEEGFGRAVGRWKESM